jgi:acylpyruvate hydrolase
MKIICIGRNYHDHIKEMNSEKPEKPVFFLKADSCILDRNRPFYIPEFSEKLHYEAEIVLRICKVGRHIPVEFAHRYYNAYTLGIDFTARDLQEYCKKNGLPWEICKSFDNSANIGDFIDFHQSEKLRNITFSLEQNGKIVQQANSDEMIFNFEEIISYVSKFMTLKMGDIIYTGTPQGVGEVAPNDTIEGFIGDKLVLKTKIL